MQNNIPYSAMRKKEILSFATTHLRALSWELKNTILRAKVSQRLILYDIIYAKNLKTELIETKSRISMDSKHWWVEDMARYIGQIGQTCSYKMSKFWES